MVAAPPPRIWKKIKKGCLKGMREREDEENDTILVKTDRQSKFVSAKCVSFKY